MTRSTMLAGATIAFALATSIHAGGETITVNTTQNVVDFTGSQFVGNLPGPDGLISFREACLAANNTAGPQTIEFAIPLGAPNEWMAGVAMLSMDGSPFLLTDNDTTVDFTTQVNLTGDTNPTGNEVGIRNAPISGAPAISVYGNRCVIKGLDRVMQVGYGVGLYRHDNKVIGCTISGALYSGVLINGDFGGVAATGNIVGGTEPGEGNVLSSGNSGVRIDGPAENNIVIGNTLSGSFWGVEIRSAYCCPGNEAINNRIGGPTPAERNIIAGAGKYGEEGFPTGGQVHLEYSIDNIIEGNYIGVLADGVTVPAQQRGPVGVSIRVSPGTIVRNNVISGIVVNGVNHADGQRFGTGIALAGTSSDTVIQGNIIGLDATGTTPVPNRQGVFLGTWPGAANATNVLVGGSGAGEGNTIAHNELAGISIASSLNSMTMLGNSIHSNGTLGIDLLIAGSPGTGVSSNDPGDGDTAGGNNLQNFPVITSADAAASAITIEGTLNSNANQSYTIELFANQQCDTSGNGEGQVLLGSVAASTDASGNGAFAATLPFTPDSLTTVTATATNLLTGDTSEFSACFPITADEPMPGDVNGDGELTSEDRAMFCAAIGSSTGDPEYLGAADMNSDGVIDEIDLALINALMPPCDGDVVTSTTFEPPADGVTDGADLAYLLGAWGAQPSCADFVSSKTFQPPPDGIVDGADLAFMLGAWGACE